MIFSGSMVGVLLACAFVPVLSRRRLWQTLLLGVLSLPLGAGLFGFFISWIQWLVMELTGMHYRFVRQIIEAPGYVFAPLKVARDYALIGTLSSIALSLIPLAILTTLHLHGRIRRLRPRHNYETHP